MIIRHFGVRDSILNALSSLLCLPHLHANLPLGNSIVFTIVFAPLAWQDGVANPEMACPYLHSKKKRAVLAPWGRFGFSKCEPFWPSMGPKQKTGAILATCRAILATF